MNIRDEERFHELAHKALANENQANEQAELQTLITEHPKLKEEFERIRTETAVAREILPMLEDLKYPQKGIPRPPMRRLRKETREVFISYGAESKRELHDLIAALEAWIDRDRSE